MPPGRRKRSPAPDKGLAPGESLERFLAPTKHVHSDRWAWVGTEVSHPADITLEHRLMACGLSPRSKYPFCPNKYATTLPEQPYASGSMESVKTVRDEDDIIVISDDEDVKCNKKSCKGNPNCLNYLGQDKWEEQDIRIRQDFLKNAMLGHDPAEDERDPNLPIGLKNLGATCYANASLQVWFRNIAFRNGVFRCQPVKGMEIRFKESPLFQLQVTFAALQESSQKVFNPTALVESLQLRTTEQQDAQEFSKLFMTHLDTEFRKQTDPDLQTLVAKQFQGTQVYGTICDTCHYQSEQSTDFLEIEIRFDGNTRLEDCISAFLQEEKLAGDNQYRCPQCDDLRDATRYTELRQLPPVLHFSLLRFVYDFSTMERRKSKLAVSFPEILDMNQFLSKTAPGELDNNVYYLQGILLHKGSSAYHGHYEAQVYDTEQKSWFQFNDESVTKIKTLGDKSSSKSAFTVASNSSSQSNGRPAKKKRRIVSDDEAESSPGTKEQNPTKTISSRDAYMLIYVRRDYQSTKLQEDSRPPKQALDVVHRLNEVHDTDCAAFVEKMNVLKEQFELIRTYVMDVYRNWNVKDSSDDCVVLSEQALQAWLTKDCIELPRSDSTPPDTAMPDANETPPAHDPIFCQHRKLDPTKAKQMKRIKRAAYQKMVGLTGCRNEALSLNDICEECCITEFQERLYNIEHPKLVREFNEIFEVQEASVGYWISKIWLKDWRLFQPKMHKPGEADPDPDSPEYRHHVWCEHDGLTSSSSNRRRISSAAVELLKHLFPTWNPKPDNAKPCTVCNALYHITKEDKRELRRRAEEEKALLKHVYEDGPLEDEELAIIPLDFQRAWLYWLNNPTEHTRPDSVDNSSFFCEHDQLTLDPNCPSDMKMIASIIHRTDWDVLETLYDSGPLISLRKRENDDGGTYEHDIPFCQECRLKRKMEWTSAHIFVQFRRSKRSGTTMSRRSTATYLSKDGRRQSERLRRTREPEIRRFAITKETTVKELKVKIQEAFKIPTICQRVFSRGQELDQNDATMTSLQIHANEVLKLEEQNEVHEIDTDTEEAHPMKKQRREEERGFGGTLLSGLSDREVGQDLLVSSSREDTPQGFTPTPNEKSCNSCTLVNAYDAVACTLCDTPFI